MPDQGNLLETHDVRTNAVFVGDDAIPPLAPSESVGVVDGGVAWAVSRTEDPMLPDRYDVPFASTDASPAPRLTTSARGAGQRLKNSSSAAEFYPRNRQGAAIQSHGLPIRSERPRQRRRLLPLALVGLLLVALLSAFALSDTVHLSRLWHTTPSQNGPQRVSAGTVTTTITVPPTATTGRGYVLRVPAGFAAQAPASDGSDVSLVSITTGTSLGVVSHAGSARPPLLVSGTAVHGRIAGTPASGVTNAKNGRVTRALEFRHDGVWYVVTESATAPAASSAFAELSKTLQDWTFSAIGS